MCTSDDEGKQINLTYQEATQLAFRAQEGDPDSLILLLEGIKETKSPADTFVLIQSAIWNELTVVGNGMLDSAGAAMRAC